MAKKKKRRIQVPSLSSFDKGIYYFLITCSILGGAILYPAIIGKYRQSIFENPHILAQGNYGIAILVFGGILLGGALALGLDWLRRKKQPIFGKSNITYGPPQWKPIYPLVSRQFWANLLSDKPLLLKKLSIILMIFLFVSFATLLAIPPRDCLYDDGSILVYNCFDRIKYSYSKSDVTEIKIFTRTYYQRNAPDDWGIEIKLSMRDGRAFNYPYSHFRSQNKDIHGSISGMYQIKQLFNAKIITIQGIDNIPNVIEDMNLNQQEIELLHLLFDLEIPTP